MSTRYRYGYLLTGNHHDAEDLVQDALIRLRAHWHRVARRDDPVGYVRTTMTRAVRSQASRALYKLRVGGISERLGAIR